MEKGDIIFTNKTCSKCNAPAVKVKPPGKRAWELCLNSECTAKKPSKK